MATYIALCNFTQQGISHVKETTERAAAARQAARQLGVDLREIYWTTGRYDLIAIIDAADEASATAFALAVGVTGNVRTETLRAFSADEVNGILGKLP
jgi:uncharacterized protein with GYD domain